MPNTKTGKTFAAATFPDPLQPPPPFPPPTHYLETRWGIAKQVKGFGAGSTGAEVEVIKLEHDGATGLGVVHIQGTPGGWQIRVTLASFENLIRVGALLPISG